VKQLVDAGANCSIMDHKYKKPEEYNSGELHHFLQDYRISQEKEALCQAVAEVAPTLKRSTTRMRM
jgi:hypothetical protein